MKKVKYTGGWSANNGSTYNYHQYSGSNKKLLANTMRAICKGNTFKGNTGHWWVSDANNNTVLSGTIRK